MWGNMSRPDRIEPTEVPTRGERRRTRQVRRLFVFARHAESAANAVHVVSTDPTRRVALTARGREQARALGAQLANLHIDLAVGTRLLRTQQTIDIALQGRPVPVRIEPGFDEIQAGGLDGAPIEAYWAWQAQHTPDDRLPQGESVNQALRRYSNALRRLLARTERITLVVTHEHALHAITTAAATGPSPFTGMPIANASPYLIDEGAARRAAASLHTLELPRLLLHGSMLTRTG
jgi:broad specificity phosphatase PhoE